MRMVGSFTKLNIADRDSERGEFFEILEAAGLATSPPVRLQGRVVVQVSGTATDIVAVVEHATRDPGSGEENWAPAEDEPFSGDLSAGIPPREYEDPAVGWWRVRVPTLTGGAVKISIIGEAG